MDPVTLSVVALAAAGTQAYGQWYSAKATSASEKYNAQVAEQNAGIATQKAQWAAQEGEQNASLSEQQSRAKLGAITANQGASGVSVDSGSSADVRSSAQQAGMLDALTIRSNAAREAYGYQTQSTSDIGQSELDRSSAGNAQTGGAISAGGTILGGAARANDAFHSYTASHTILSTGTAYGGSNPTDDAVLSSAMAG